MIRRNFLKAIASVLGFGAVAPTVKASFTPKVPATIPIKLLDGYYFYNYGRIVQNVDCKVKVGDNLFQGEDGKITNKPPDKSGYSSLIGTAYSNSDENGWCVIQLVRSWDYH